MPIGLCIIIIINCAANILIQIFLNLVPAIVQYPCVYVYYKTDSEVDE